MLPVNGQPYMDCSPETAAIVDREIQKLLDENYKAAKQLLSDNRALLDDIALHLLNKETITGDEMMAFVKAAQEEKTENKDESER